MNHRGSVTQCTVLPGESHLAALTPAVWLPLPESAFSSSGSLLTVPVGGYRLDVSGSFVSDNMKHTLDLHTQKVSFVQLPYDKNDIGIQCDVLLYL